MAESRIEWTDATWNPVTGCTKVSQGCKHCYADRMAHRLQAMGVHKYRNGFEVTLHPDTLQDPLSWRVPQRIFVNSMSDLFHEMVAFEFIDSVIETMRQAYWHQFQILTKRSKRLVELATLVNWPSNVWMGVSVEDEKVVHRIDDLRSVPCAVRFLSLEPLIGPLPNLDLTGIDWVIVGGESGPGARPMQEEWVRDIRNQCTRQGVAFFFKQWGGTNKKVSGRTLDGFTWDEMPEVAPRFSTDSSQYGRQTQGIGLVAAEGLGRTQ